MSQEDTYPSATNNNETASLTLHYPNSMGLPSSQLRPPTADLSSSLNGWDGAGPADASPYAFGELPTQPTDFGTAPDDEVAVVYALHNRAYQVPLPVPLLNVRATYLDDHLPTNLPIVSTMPFDSPYQMPSAPANLDLHIINASVNDRDLPSDLPPTASSSTAPLYSPNQLPLVPISPDLHIVDRTVGGVSRHYTPKPYSTDKQYKQANKVKKWLEGVEVPLACLTSEAGHWRGTYTKTAFSCRWAECQEEIVLEGTSHEDTMDFQRKVHVHIHDHAKIVDGGRRCKWKGCDKRGAYEGTRGLDRHIKSHVGGFGFYCEECMHRGTRRCTCNKTPIVSSSTLRGQRGRRV